MDRAVVAAAPEPSASRGETRIEAIDGLRALAMLMVYTFHVWEFGGTPTLTGHIAGVSVPVGLVISSFPAGVSLFMVLSGFCLFWPLCIRPERLVGWSVKDYYRRRVRRIVPPYYAALVYLTILPNLLVVVTKALHRPANWQALPSLWQYVSHILFLHGLTMPTWAGIEPCLWTLGLEAQFYLVFPLVVFGYRRWGLKVTGGMIALSTLYYCGVMVLLAHTHWTVRALMVQSFLGRWMEFAGGMIAAWIVAQMRLSGKTISARNGVLLLAGGLGLYALSMTGAVKALTSAPLVSLLLTACFAMLIVVACASKNGLRRMFENRLMAGLGFISYSIYLLHQNTAWYASEIMKKFLHLNGLMRFAILETIGFVGIVALAMLFFRCFEAPFLKSSRPNKKSGEANFTMPQPDGALSVR